MCGVCKTLHETTQEAAMVNELCLTCWKCGWRPDGLGGTTLRQQPDPARLEEFDQVAKA
jgi:hypothetical protein